MGFFSNLDTEGYDRQYSDRQLLQRMAGYFHPYSKRLLLIVILLIFISATGAILPVVVSRGVDVVTQNLPLSTTILLFLIIFFTGVANCLANWQRRLITVKTIADIE